MHFFLIVLSHSLYFHRNKSKWKATPADFSVDTLRVVHVGFFLTIFYNSLDQLLVLTYITISLSMTHNCCKPQRTHQADVYLKAFE